MARGFILLCAIGAIGAIGAVACGSILHLGDYEVGADDGDASTPTSTPEGGAPVTLDGGITLSTTSLAFPDGKCGDKKTLPIIITNQSNAAVPLMVTAPAGITIDGAVPTVAAGGNVTLTIGTTGVDHGNVTLELGGQSFDIPLTAKFHGPRLGLATNTVDFGEIRHGSKSAPQTIEVDNTGDEDVTITGVGAGMDFSLDGPVNVPANGKATASFTMAAGPGGDPITANAPLTTDKPLCDALPAIVFSGRRSATDVTVGKTSVNLVCNNGSQPASVPVVVSNFGADTVKIDAKYTAPLVVNPPSVQLGPGTADVPTSTSFNVNFNTLKLGDYTYDLVITEGSLAPRTVTINVHLDGAQLQYSTGIFSVNIGQTVGVPASNLGNVPVCVHYAADTAGYLSVEPDEEFAPNVAGDIKVTGLSGGGGGGGPGGHHQRVRVKVSAVPCSGASAPAPLCGSLSTLDFDVR